MSNVSEHAARVKRNEILHRCFLEMEKRGLSDLDVTLAIDAVVAGIPCTYIITECRQGGSPTLLTVLEWLNVLGLTLEVRPI